MHPGMVDNRGADVKRGLAGPRGRAATPGDARSVRRGSDARVHRVAWLACIVIVYAMGTADAAITRSMSDLLELDVSIDGQRRTIRSPVFGRQNDDMVET